MFDSAYPEFPAGAKYLLAYIDGPYANVGSALATGAYVVTITIGGDLDADCCDIEPGCMTLYQGALWALRRQQMGRIATQYFSMGNLDNVIWWNERLGVDPSKVFFFGANPDGVAEVPPGYVAKQFAWGRSTPPGAWDTSVCQTSWPALPQPAPPPLPGGNMLFEWNGTVYLAGVGPGQKGWGIPLKANAAVAVKAAAAAGKVFIIQDIEAGLYNQFVAD